MKRFIILMTFLAMLPFTAQAAAKKKKAKLVAKPAASIVAVVGRADVSVDDGKTYKAGKLGQNVPVGGILRTKTGKMTLLLSEGSNVHLGENSEMTLKQHNPEADKGGSIFSMAKGLARFVVHKLQPGKSFEVVSSNAVAAVKGTDFIMILQRGGETIVKVFKTDTLSAVLLSGLNREKSVLLKENTQGGFDGKSFTEDKFEVKDQNEFKNKFEGLPVVPPQELNTEGDAGGENEEGEGNGNGDGSGTEDGNSSEEGSGTEEESGNNSEGGDGDGFNTDEIVNDVIEDFYEEVADDAAKDNLLQANDIAEGRVIYDRQGYETQVFHLITRPNAYEIVNQAMSVREFGPNSGVTMAEETMAWNLPLPEDWASVAGRALDHPDNLDGGGYPIYFRTWGDFWASNPVGDTFEAYTTFYVPNFCIACGAGVIQQGFKQQYYLNGYNGPTNNFYIDYRINESVGTQISSQGLQISCSGCSANLQMTASPDEENGGWSFAYDHLTSGDVFIENLFTQHLTLIDDNGSIFDTSGFGGVTRPNDFRGSGLHVEMTLSSSYFSQDIDLIFLQGFFDTFDTIQFPIAANGTTYSGCGGC